MKEHQQRLRAQVGALQLLIQVVQMLVLFSVFAVIFQFLILL
jgi:hypothetical protein